jgi:hypothetical protein
VLNRILPAVTRAGERHSKGRHRRPSTPSRPPTAPAATALTDEPTVALPQIPDSARHRYQLTGEETALIRPYMPAWEKHAQQHSTVAMAPHLPTEAWSALLETV